MTLKRGRGRLFSGDEKEPDPPKKSPPPDDNGGYKNPGDTEVRWIPPLKIGDIYRNPGDTIPRVKKGEESGRTRR